MSGPSGRCLSNLVLKGYFGGFLKTTVGKNELEVTVELKSDYVLGFIIRGIFTVITLQDWVGWGIFFCCNSGVSTESEQ